MIDWSASMQQTFEYYVVDPNTWTDGERLTNVKTCTITRDSETETLGSASIGIVGSLGECYVRIYLVAIQNGVTEKIPLGTFMVQTPSAGFDGKIRDVTVDAYTPLLELKEKLPPIGYSIFEGSNVVDYSYRLCREHVRSPVMRTQVDETLYSDFVSDPSDTWLSFVVDLLNAVNYELGLDEMGRILFFPRQDTAALQPVWTYSDDENSILYPEISIDHDLYEIPNVVEVVYSTSDTAYEARVVNDDPNSITSTVNRGREIVYRDTSPILPQGVMLSQVNEYATRLLKTLSTVKSTVTYKHAYCPVKVGDCVRFNHLRADLRNINAKVVSQNITCEPGCPVSEKAEFTMSLWG